MKLCQHSDTVVNNEMWNIALYPSKFQKSDSDDCILDNTTVDKSDAFCLNGATYVKYETYINIKYYFN